MHIQPAIGLLAVVLAICLPGCSKNKLATVEISEVRPADRQSVHAVGRIDSLMSELQRERALLKALQHGSNARLIVDQDIRTSKAARDIVNRISDCLADWDEYRAELSSSSRLQSTQDEFDQQLIKPGVASKQNESIEAIRRKYAGDHINWNMRIALLESRLAAASEHDKKLLTEKLDQAKAAQNAVDEAFRAEIEQLEHTDEESSVSAQTVDTNPADAVDQHPAGKRSISPRLRDFYSSTEPEKDGGARLVRTSVNLGYHTALVNTCNSIDQVLLLFRQSDSAKIDR